MNSNPHPFPCPVIISGSTRENRQRPNGFSAHGLSRARHPISSPSSPVSRQGHGLTLGLNARGVKSAHPPTATGNKPPAPGIPPDTEDPLAPIRAGTGAGAVWQPGEDTDWMWELD